MYAVKFQSFLFWMLIRKLYIIAVILRMLQVSILLILDVDSEVGDREVGDFSQRLVSILLILDVDSEAETIEYLTFPVGCFNPSYSGC